ncbi:alkaline phosphatase family protein, partial [Nostoc sp.]
MKKTLFGVLTTAIVSSTLIPGVQAISIGNTTARFSHVLIISIDGLHNWDLSVANLQSSLKNIKRLQREGVTYTNAFTSAPSDSYPGELNYITGAKI